MRTLGLVPVAAALTASLLTGCGGNTDENADAIVRTTTNIAGAGVVGNGRDTTKACALPSNPDTPSGTHAVAHAAGNSEVPADPKRIVVLSTSALDATCALGLWERVVGAATVAGPTAQPAYLGTGIAAIPAVGTVDHPDATRIAALDPDLIIGTSADNGQYDALKAVAPTVLVGTDKGWQAEFTGFADALNRRTAGARALDDYRAAAKDTGAAVHANLTQASVIRFEPDAIRIQGADSFAGQVLGDAGVQRPQSQRGNSAGVGPGLSAQDERRKLEGDLIYLMFDGTDGQKFGESVMKGDDWKSLGAVSDRREFAVADSIWNGNGITAARALLEDLSKTLNGYVND